MSNASKSPAPEAFQETSRAGERLRYRVHGAGRHPAPPMLLYNGLVSSDAHWPFFLRHFAARRPVLFWDYRGHGGQPPPRDLSTLTVEDCAEDAHAVAATGLGRPAIGVALSFGVQVALEHWRRHPADLGALVLLCGTDGHPLDRLSAGAWLRRGAGGLLRWFGRGGPAARLFLRAGHSGLGREIAFLSGGAHRDQCPPEVLDRVFGHAASLDPRVVGRLVAAYLEHSARDVLPTIGVPTLILAGDRDQLTPVSCAERMQRSIAGARLVVYPGHSHLVQVERPDDVHGEIERFLEGAGL